MTTKTPEPTDPTAALYAALASAQGAFPALRKSARHEQGFEYVPSDVVIAHAGKVLRDHGLALCPVSQTLVDPPASAVTYGVKTREGNVERGCAAVYRCVYRIVHRNGGHMEITRDMPLPKEWKAIDKLSLGASTEVLSYLLRDLFMIDRGVGIDITGRVDGVPVEEGDGEDPPQRQRPPRSDNGQQRPRGDRRPSRQPSRGRPGPKSSGPVDGGPLKGPTEEEQGRIDSVRQALQAMKAEGWSGEALAQAAKACGIVRGDVPTQAQVDALHAYWDEGSTRQATGDDEARHQRALDESAGE